ncbi:gag-proteinase polyprotein [Cucumis melo var. makuwa]|uniref:Gag-proteinase polyprotein n=1 Tax=Cucumis melo var. makuwa TaxID=1194695 RepID=A0A5D3DR56_CUCMM|nr:gag-proteinase polyprotein [Cucumis melo var. makuwa]TYK26038.1 gag-proteinase polyprotein [Cucumis melo var. makuwa]
MEIIREGPSASRPPVLDAWRALVANYDAPMITVNGVSVPELEVNMTDAEEQASVGNTRALNALFNGVNLNVFKLINSCSTTKEAWKTLEIAYEVRKVFQSLPRKFDMKVTAIEEAHDITTLKLDELFGSLLTFEMATADRKSKKGKGIAFRSTHVGEEAVSDIEANMDELIALLTKQFTNALRKLKNMNATGDSRDDDDNINALTIRITDENTDDESECSEESKNDELTIEKLEALRKKDCEARNLDSILKSGHNGSHRHGLGFVASASRLKATSEIKFVPALMGVEHETIHTETDIRTTVKSLGRTCYYCG